MDNFGEQNCRLCLDAISDNNFEQLSDITEETLNILLLKLDLDKNKSILCIDCARKMREALKFKSMCVCTENVIIPYVDNVTGNSVDLLEIYAKEKGKEQLIGHKICRLCMQLIKGKYMLVSEVEIDVIEEYIPEINFSIVDDPVICKQCFDSLGIHSTFIKNCLKMEEKIKTSGSTASALCVKIENGVVKREESYYEEESLKNKLKVQTFNEGDQYQIKTEYIDVKSEESSERDTSQRSSPTRNVVSETQMCKCLYCDYETTYKYHLKKHIVLFHKSMWLHPKEKLKIRRITTEKYRCNECNFTSRYRIRLKKHQLTHKGLLQVPLYKCDECSYESRRRSHLKSHQLKHKDPLQVQMYKCDECNYESRYRYHFERHQLKHKDPSHVPMYRCDECSFESMYRENLRKHQLKHKDPSQVQMYKCDKCSYESRYMRYLKQHQLKKHPSQVQMYKCDKCSYESRYKHYWKQHQLKTHKDPSYMQTYKCDECDYTNMYKQYFRMHQLTHKDSSQTGIYKCDKCSFASRYKVSLKNHQLTHKDASQVEMYKCDKCNFVSRYKASLINHQLNHKDPSQVRMYKCDKCDYESRRKHCLTRHVTMHQRSRTMKK